MIRKAENMKQSVQHKHVGTEILLKWWQRSIHYLVHRLGIHIFILGFLLGRAVIIGDLTPFAIPFIAVVYERRKDKVMVAVLAVLTGALAHDMSTLMALLAAVICLLSLQKLVERRKKETLAYTPFIVFTAVLLAHCAVALVIDWTGHAIMMAVVNASLGLVLTLIFVQSLSIFSIRWRKQPLKNEELVCLVILLASVLSGTVGWLFLGLSVEHVLSRYVILVFALAAGGAAGAMIGVVTGLILSLANGQALLEMSLLAFSGLLSGLLKEGGKLGVAIGLIVATLLFGLYMGDTHFMQTFQESLLAIALLLMTPQAVFKKISQYIPGTTEHTSVQEDYMKSLRQVTAHKVKQFSELFQHLAESFSGHIDHQAEDRRRQIDFFLSRVTEHSCQICFKKEKCWQEKYAQTYDLMNVLFEELEQYGKIKRPHIQKRLANHCIKSEKILDLMESEMQHYQTYLMYKNKLSESKRLVADQLTGVSQVMLNFAREIKKDSGTYDVKEQELLDALADIGLVVRAVDILSMNEGNVEIDVVQPYVYSMDECKKIVAPLLSDLIGESIEVDEARSQMVPDGLCRIRLKSAQEFVVRTGMASAAKGGGLLSGDCSQTMDVGSGKYALAISDGMGNGERAHMESNETLSLLQHLLQSGIDEQVAIQSINSVLSLRSTEEIFSTLDLAMVDLQSAQTKFIKIGSAPSFIKRGDECTAVSASNLPIGILNNIEVEVVSRELKAEDMLIMISDGIYDAPHFIEREEQWLCRLIKEIKTNDPQDVADLLLEKVIRYHQGKIRDDMTVLVARIERKIPEWSTISHMNIPKFREQYNGQASI